MISSLYIDNNGFLMCGEPDMASSIIDGVRLESVCVDAPGQLDFNIVFINDLEQKCLGYEKRCDIKYKYSA